MSSCRKLQVLHLSYITGLRGPGVSSIGDNQLPLRGVCVLLPIQYWESAF